MAREGLRGYEEREGSLPNWARLIVGSFFTKIRSLDRRSGADVFYELLVDGDVANNVGNRQWLAGAGADTRPDRVLNPVRRAKRFDPSRRPPAHA